MLENCLQIPWCYLIERRSEIEAWKLEAVLKPAARCERERHSAKLGGTSSVDVEARKRHSGPEYLKKSRPKKLVKSNKSISQNFILTNFHFFAISKMAQNQFLN